MMKLRPVLSAFAVILGADVLAHPKQVAIAIESKTVGAANESIRTRTVTSGSERVLVSIEKTTAGNDTLKSITEIYYFKGDVVAVYYRNILDRVSYFEIKKDAPISIRVEDSNSDGIVDRIEFKVDDDSKLFFSDKVQVLIRNKQLGMIPVANRLVDENGVVYSIDASDEEVRKVSASESGQAKK
jgi:hypothetical protein